MISGVTFRKFPESAAQRPVPLTGRSTEEETPIARAVSGSLCV